MAQKCVHQGCGKAYTDPSEVCRYHPGPPIFHEGQKGWKCCKPRVLTFEEFMSIKPCTEGKHSTTDLPPKVEKREADPSLLETANAASTRPRNPIAAVQPGLAPPPPPAESEDDEDDVPVPDGARCRRKACRAAYTAGSSRDGESCTHHPGAPIFHEGSKGYSCCKRRVLEFDQFMKIDGCKTKPRHLFVGSGKGKEKQGLGAGTGAGIGAGSEEMLEMVRHDFYQTPTSVIVSFFLKEIDKNAATVAFGAQNLQLDLPTTDRKRYCTSVPLFASIDTGKSSYKVLQTKLEVTLAKADGESWPVLRSDERLTGQILQIGQAGKAQ